VLGDQVEIADTSKKRKKGLLKHTGLPPGHGLWIVPCEGVHTFWMKFRIDVVFLNKNRKVLKIRKDMKEWRMAFCLTAHSVLEFPSGTLQQTGTVPGDQLVFEK
jgi:uncharacterized membrane protein (UPF0127 family)